MPRAITIILTEILMWLLCMMIPNSLIVVANSSNSFWYCVEWGSRSIHSSVWTACCVLVCWYWRTLVPLQLIRACDSNFCRCLSSYCSWSGGDCRMCRICSYYVMAVHDVMMWCCGALSKSNGLDGFEFATTRESPSPSYLCKQWRMTAIDLVCFFVNAVFSTKRS